MDRFYRLSSFLFGYLAFALALLAPLAVPQNAFADSGMDCWNTCNTSCTAQCGTGDMTCMTNCMLPCNASCTAGANSAATSGGDPILQAGCCQAICMGEPGCVASCAAFAAATCDTNSTTCTIIKDDTDCFPGGASGNIYCPAGQVKCACR